MPDLYFVQDERPLREKWNYLLALFRVVARDYKRVLGEEIPHDRHNDILKQTVSDLLDVEADLFRIAKNSPADEFDPWMNEAWAAAVAWVREFRSWQIPRPEMPNAECALARTERTIAERRFNEVVVRMPDLPRAEEPADGPTVLVHYAV